MYIWSVFPRLSHFCAPQPPSHSSENSWLVSCTHKYVRIYYTICLYCISNCNFVFVSCSQSCLHLPLPHPGPIPDVETTPSSPQAKIQPAGRNRAMQIVCLQYILWCCICAAISMCWHCWEWRRIVCTSSFIVLWSCVLFLSVILLIPMHMHMYTDQLCTVHQVQYWTSFLKFQFLK